MQRPQLLQHLHLERKVGVYYSGLMHLYVQDVQAMAPKLTQDIRQTCHPAATALVAFTQTSI